MIKKLAKILEWNDYANFGDRVVELRYGEEGVDFTYDENRKPVRADSFVEEGDRGIQAYSLKIQTSELLDLTADPIFESTYEYSVDDGKWIKYLIPPYKFDLLNETNLVDVTSQYASSINTLVSEFRVNVITGETDLDAMWDQYISNLNSAGYEEICEELDKAPLYSDLTNG